MPDLRAFADFARLKGLFPAFHGEGNSPGNSGQKNIHKQCQPLMTRVPHVPRVPRQIDIGTKEMDWRAFFDERAGVREFEGGLARAEAERLAYADTVAALGPRPANWPSVQDVSAGDGFGASGLVGQSLPDRELPPHAGVSSTMGGAIRKSLP